jgi:hypothetical protein
MPGILCLLLISLFPLFANAEDLRQLDTLVWSFDTGSSRIYYGNDPIDSIILADSVMSYFRMHPAHWRKQGKGYSLPDTILVDQAPVSAKLMLDKKFVAQGSLNRGLRDGRQKLLASMTLIRPHFLTATIILFEKSVRGLQCGTEILVREDDSLFIAWSLNDRFNQAKQDIGTLLHARDTLAAFLKNCPDTANAFYSYKKLFQLVTLLNGAIDRAAHCRSALESADRKVQGEIAAINTWINDVLLGELIAIESFCFQNVPAVKSFCYEDLVAYVVSAEKRGIVQFSLDDLGKIRVRR